MADRRYKISEYDLQIEPHYVEFEVEAAAIADFVAAIGAVKYGLYKV